MKKIFFIVFALMFCLGLQNVSAQENGQGDINDKASLTELPNDVGSVDNEVVGDNVATTTLDEEQEEGVTVIATVNFYDAVVKKQKDNIFDINFVIGNGEHVQPGIKYAVQLIKHAETKNIVVDEKVYDDVLSLGANDAIEKNIRYEAPSFFEGKYYIQLVSNSQDGMPLAMWSFQDPVTLKGDGKYVELKDCVVTTGATEKKGTVGLDIGLDIKPGEELLVRCTVDNHSTSAVDAQAQYTFFERSFFNQKNVQKVNGGSVKIDSDEVVFKVPYVDKPQAYDVSIELIDADGQKVSNDIVAHYVLQGESATVQGIHTDKSAYKKGEKAQVFFILSGNAGNFDGARYENDVTKSVDSTLDIVLKDSQGICAQKTVKTTFEESDFQTVDVDVTRNCSEPQALLTLKNDQGKTLYETQMKISESGNPVQPKFAKGQEKQKDWFYLMLAIALIIPFSIVGVHLFRKRGTPTSLMFFVLLSSVFFGSTVIVNNVYANTYLDYDDHVTYVVNWPQAGYYGPGSSVSVAASIPVVMTCGNFNFIKTLVVCGINEKVDTIVKSLDCDKACAHGSGLCKVCRDTTLESKTFTVPDNCSDNNLVCELHVCGEKPCEDNWRITPIDSVPLGTQDCPHTDGVCKLQRTPVLKLDSKPTQSDLTLCSAGTATTIQGDGSPSNPWTWNCNGSGPTHTNQTGCIAQMNPGRCTTSALSYNYPTSDWPNTNNSTFCELGAPNPIQNSSTFPVINPNKNPLQNATRSWKCSTVGGDSGSCTATLMPPTLSCSSKPESGTVPTDPLCDSSDGRFIKPTPTLLEDATPKKQWGWDCIHNDFPLQLTSHCTAPLPKATCGTQPPHSTDTTPPSGSYTLCGTSCSATTTPVLESDGKWHWDCKYDQTADPQEVPCETPSCLAGTPIEYQKYVYFKSNGEPNDASVKVMCPGVCCKIKDTVGTPSDVIICDDDTPNGYIEVLPGSKTYPTECWFDKDNNDKDNGESKVNVNVTIGTMCTARECNAQGTCQVTPVAAQNLNNPQCKSSCNSNADCSSGRTIETKP